MNLNFKIKICGVTNVDDALAAIDAGADAIGLNFYPLSRRHVSRAVAHLITVALPASVTKVGVFVNSSMAQIVETAGASDVQWVQLHGDEPAEYIEALSVIFSVVCVYRSGNKGLAPLAEYLDACSTHGCQPNAVLIDADVEATDEYGGTGRVADWRRIADERELLGDMPLILAGGLKTENVAEAIRIVRPHAVDVASGVESVPGKKDPQKMRKFVAAARAAFAAI